MPTFDTGNAQWDQGLGSLAASLFPDPSRIAQAGYLGAQTRKTQAEADQMRVQRNALRLLPSQHIWGTAPNPPQYSQPGPRLPGPTVPIGPWPSQAGGGTGMATTGQGQPPAGPPQSMAAAVAPGGPQLPVAQSEEQVGMPGYQPGSATAMAQIFTQGPNKLTSGPLPPTSSPAPGAGAPAAPNATASDGSFPQNDETAGRFHPGSFMPPGGGEKFAPPAQANGSPAPPMDLSGVYTMAYQAGLRGDDLVNYMASAIIEGQQHGVIDHNTATQALASLNRGMPLQADTTLAQQGISTGGDVGQRNRQWDQGTVQVIGPDNKLTGVSRDKWYPNQDKYRAVDPGTASVIAGQMYTPQTVYGENPDKTVDPSRTEIVTRADAITQHRRPAPDVPAIATNTPKAEEGAIDREKLLDSAISQMYPTEKGQGMTDFPRMEKTLLPPEWRSAVTNRALDIFNKDPTLRGDQKNIGEAYRRSMQAFQQEGYLPSPDEVKKERQRGLLDTRIFTEDPALVGSGKTKNGKPIMRFPVKPLKPVPPEWQKAGDVFTKVGKSNKPTQPPAAQGQQTAREGIHVPGGQEGEVRYAPDGTPLIIHGGVAVELTASEKQQFDAALRAGGK
jgi:hypothetical protein